MGGIIPPPDYHRQLNRKFARKLIAVNIVVIILIFIIMRGLDKWVI